MNASDLPTARARTTFRAIRDNEIPLEAVLAAIGASHAVDWCVTHDGVCGDVGALDPGCKFEKLFRIGAEA